MSLHIRPSSLLWAAFLALGGGTLVLRLRHPGHPALSVLTAALLLLLALRLVSMLLDWRAGRLPATRLLLPAVLLAEGLGLAMTGASPATTSVRFATAAGLELLLLVLAVRSLRRTRALPGQWPEDRIAAAFAAFVPPRAARLMALELVMLGSALGFLLGGFQRPDPAGFSLHHEATLRSLLPALPLLIPADVFLLHALFPHMAPWGRWTLHLSTVYGLLWMVGLYAALKARPHQIEADSVRLHMGPLASLRLDRAQILSASALPYFEDDGARRTYMKGMHKLLRAGVPTVELRLGEAIPCTGLLGPGDQLLDRVAVSVDDPAAFLTALGRPCA